MSVAAEAGEAGRFEGYASVFGREDQGRDVVLPGAFRRALARRGAARIRMLWHHDPREPIGAWTDVFEDAHGLRARGRLVLEVGRGREALALIRAGAVDGLSIGFRTVRARTDRRTGTRQLIELDLWEISLVSFPMNDGARIGAVKDAGLIGSLRRAAEAMRPSPGSPLRVDPPSPPMGGEGSEGAVRGRAG